MRVRDSGTSDQGASERLPRIARGWRPPLGVITSKLRKEPEPPNVSRKERRKTRTKASKTRPRHIERKSHTSNFFNQTGKRQDEPGLQSRQREGYDFPRGIVLLCEKAWLLEQSFAVNSRALPGGPRRRRRTCL